MIKYDYNKYNNHKILFDSILSPSRINNIRPFIRPFHITANNHNIDINKKNVKTNENLEKSEFGLKMVGYLKLFNIILAIF